MEQYVEITQLWMEKVVIDLGFCPFFKKGLNEPEIYSYDVSSRQEVCESLIVDSRAELALAVPHSFNIYPQCRLTFRDFFFLSKDLQELFDENGLLFEIICFHPEFQFEGLDKENAVNFVNRSPFPSLHLVSKHLMDKALVGQELDFGEKISGKNSEILSSFSYDELEEKVVKYSKGFWKGL